LKILYSDFFLHCSSNYKFTKLWNSDNNIDLIETVQLYDNQPKDVSPRKKLKISELPTIIICDTKEIVKTTQDLEDVYAYLFL
jgi:hypothetical protein